MGEGAKRGEGVGRRLGGVGEGQEGCRKNSSWNALSACSKLQLECTECMFNVAAGMH